jgi:hypothetical protein
MAKIRLFCESGANGRSYRVSGLLDSVDDLGLDAGEWESLSYPEKYNRAVEWANERLEIYYEEEV